jgi:ATP-binding cassette subfamily F protein uup
MSLISCQEVGKTFGAHRLFENVSLTIAKDERIGLIGPNGAGKTTLLQVLAGVQPPDSGVVTWRKGLRLGYVPQEIAFMAGDTVRSVIAAASSATEDTAAGREALANVTLGRIGFIDFDSPADKLSGGWRKRLAIAREIVREPDVLLLDEPTNHLDLDGILWLERFLAAANFAWLAVSHDRYFLENVATDMAEISRAYPGGLFRVHGNYSEFLIRREEFLEAQAKQQESLANKVRKEVEWLRRGPKARTTKSKARIDTAGRMMDELASLETRSASPAAQIDFAATGRQTKKLFSAKSIAKSFGGRALIENVDIALAPGTRLGLVGPNGSGKTTMLRIIAGELEPDRGDIERAEALRIVYFDQHREQLDFESSLRRALCPHGDHVIYRDRPLHVAAWANRFLFRREQLDLAIGRLSGGERARVAIARLMLRPADLLLLDEPTNDLDIPTLEVLEESLLEFPGAIVLVTNDRYLLDRVSTVVLGLGEAPGTYADYSQWERARSEKEVAAATAKADVIRAAAPEPKKRLSYMEAREWATIEQRIEQAEAELTACQSALHDPEVTRDPRRLQEEYGRMQEAQATVDRLYERWADLDRKRA